MIEELLSPLFTTAWGRRAGTWVMIAMITLAGLALLQVIYSWAADIRLSHQKAHAADSSAQAAKQLAELIIEIPSWHLFGRYSAGDQTAFLPITSLQLRLVGVIKSTPEKFSRAIISEAGQPGKVYQIGDSLSSGVKVSAINTDSVILDNAGRLEKLPLQRSVLQFKGMPKSLLNSSQGE